MVTVCRYSLTLPLTLIIIIIMYISAHIIHINLNTIFYDHLAVEWFCIGIIYRFLYPSNAV